MSTEREDAHTNTFEIEKQNHLPSVLLILNGDKEEIQTKASFIFKAFHQYFYKKNRTKIFFFTFLMVSVVSLEAHKQLESIKIYWLWFCVWVCGVLVNLMILICHWVWLFHFSIAILRTFRTSHSFWSIHAFFLIRNNLFIL